MTAPPVLLAVDGNSLLHRAFHASRNDETANAALRLTVSQVLLAVQRTSPSAVVIGFDDERWSRRQTKFPHYKANRSPHPTELDDQLALAVDTFFQMGFCVVVPDGLEADDVVASASVHATEQGWRTVIATSDRDSFALINETTRILRVTNGGVRSASFVGPNELHEEYGVWPSQYRDYAAMRGDPSDGLTGIPGVGPKKAANLIDAYGTLAAVLAAAESGDETLAKIAGKAVAATLTDPEARATCLETWRIMRMLTDVQLDLNFIEPGAGLLPYPPSWVRAGLEDINAGEQTVNNAVAVLCGAG